jgi:LmbE family N-acetylglucosaminyl deacetylase
MHDPAVSWQHGERASHVRAGLAVEALTMRADPILARLCGSGPGNDAPSTLLLAAHPDDEAIGAGAMLARIGRRCRVVHLTEGAPANKRLFPPAAENMTRAAYVRVRRQEAARALALAGVEEESMTNLGLRDHEAVFELVKAVERLGSVLRACSPEAILCHAYEGGHPDHDAAAFVAHAAVALSRAHGLQPVLVEMATYHDRAGSTIRGEFLPVAGSPEEVILELGDDERRHKRAMFAAYATQRDVLAAFRGESERFRVAPRYQFAAPPHGGRLHYERFGFGMAGTMWRAFARSALKKLGLGEGML